jgi:hypothetical protein
MNPHTLQRLQKSRDDTKPALWVEVSADDVLEACSALEPADEVTGRLGSSSRKVLEGRPPARRGPPARRPIIVHRKDLEHLLTRLEPPEEAEPPAPGAPWEHVRVPAGGPAEPAEPARGDEGGTHVERIYDSAGGEPGEEGGDRA